MLLLFSILFCFEAHSGFLDFEELASVNYGIDIIDKPVMAGKVCLKLVLSPSKCDLMLWFGQASRQQTIYQSEENTPG